MTSDALLQYCLTKSGACLCHPFGEDPVCIKVEGRIFAALYLHRFVGVTRKCEPMRADLYRSQFPGVVVRGYHCPPTQQPHRNTVYFEHISDDILLEMLDHSYREVVNGLPRKVRCSLLSQNF